MRYKGKPFFGSWYANIIYTVMMGICVSIILDNFSGGEAQTIQGTLAMVFGFISIVSFILSMLSSFRKYCELGETELIICLGIFKTIISYDKIKWVEQEKSKGFRANSFYIVYDKNGKDASKSFSPNDDRKIVISEIKKRIKAAKAV